MHESIRTAKGRTLTAEQVQTVTDLLESGFTPEWVQESVLVRLCGWHRNDAAELVDQAMYQTHYVG